jgi:AraC-like DNA-binding protein
MQLTRHRPAPPLDRYINCFWWSHRDEAQHHGEHMLPSGGAQMLFALHESPILCSPSAAGESIAWSGSVVHGPQSEYYVSGAKPKKIFAILEESLRARFHRPLLMHPAVAQALASRAAASPARVADLQRLSGYSAKHFISLFRCAVGLTPKHFYRIQRFNSVVRGIAASQGRPAGCAGK